MEKIRVLIVDDSIFMRKTLSKIINSEKIEVIDTAANGEDAIEKIKALDPDVVTLDIEMPIMNGIEALRVIMAEHPLPVIMVSTLTSDGAEATIEAIGAVDFVTKKSIHTEMYSLQDEIVDKILQVGNDKQLRQSMRRRALILQKRKELGETKDISETDSLATKLAEKARARRAITSTVSLGKRPRSTDIQVLTIGISTGGPVALLELFKRLPGNIPVPILVVQHMPPYFTKSLATRLNGLSQLQIKEAEDGEKVMPGCVYFAPGGRQLTINKRHLLVVSDEPKDELYKPSVNVLVNSIVDVYGKHTVGVIMTGMGHDGRDSFRKLKYAGGYVISQDIDSCVVAGMPRSVIEAGLADEIYPLNDMAGAIASLFGLTTVD